MDLKDIQELIKFVAKSGATEVDLEMGDVKICIKSPPKGKIITDNQSATLSSPQPLGTQHPFVTCGLIIKKLLLKKNDGRVLRVPTSVGPFTLRL